MKKLYMKQQLFSFIDRFSVKDENEQDRYIVEADHLQVGGKKLHIRDMEGNEIAMVQQKVLSLMPKCLVFKNGEQVAEIKKKIALFGSKYLVEGPGWEVKGKILNHDYSVIKGATEVISLHKVWLSWGDSYEIDIVDSVDDDMALAVVLAIDMALEAQESAKEASEN